MSTPYRVGSCPHTLTRVQQQGKQGPVMTGPSRAFAARDNHRNWLGLHFVALVAGLAGAFLANRFGRYYAGDEIAPLRVAAE